MSINEDKEEFDFTKETFRLFNENKRKFIYRLKNKIKNPTHKKLLKAFYLYRTKKVKESLKLIETTNPSKLSDIAFKLYLKGLIYNYQTKYHYALENLEEAFDIFQSKKDDLADSCLIVILFIKANQADVESIKNLFPLLERMQLKTQFAKISTIQIKAIYLLLQGHHNEAKELINNTFKNYSLTELESYLPDLLITLFNANLMQKNYDRCYEILKKYKIHNGHYVKVNYSYMNSLLDHITKNKKIYFYANKYQDFPEMYWQLNVIQALQLGDKFLMKKYWDSLSRFNPEMYRKNYIYNGANTLFKTCIDKYQTNISQKIDIDIIKEKLVGVRSPVERCYIIITDSSGPMHKYDLLELIYGHKYTQKNGAKLRNTISLCKKRYNIQIIFYQDTYLFVDDTNQIKAG